MKEFLNKPKSALVLFLAGAVIVYAITREQYQVFRGQPDAQMLEQLGWNLGAAVLGFGVGFLPLFLLTRYWAVGVAFAALVYLYFVLAPGLGTGAVAITGTIAFVAGAVMALVGLVKKGIIKLPTTFGSSRWATIDDVKAAGLNGDFGFRLGTYFDEEPKSVDLRYAGQRHLLTVAPTRGGKGVSAIIPNLLTHPGSVLVIDPKGENALVTAPARKKLGQDLYVVDPWGLAAPKLGLAPARFNPLDWLVVGDLDLNENAMLLADALVVSQASKDPFWDQEARALIYGFLIYLATEQDEEGHRTLGRLREILTLPPRDSSDPNASAEGTMDEILIKMAGSDLDAVRSSYARYIQKEDRERSSVLSTAQSHTHFLESPRIRETLSKSDFDFEQLKTGTISVYLILPADRLDTFGRWLRLLIQQALTQTARNITARPRYPVLFMLDEMPTLGHLKSLEQAYGLMAGFGMQLWGIVQDLSQLKRIYGDGWETFVSNSGVLQYFGSRDKMTAEYFSTLCGVTTVWNISTAISTALGGGGSKSTSQSAAQRSLIYADELMTMRNESQLVLIEATYPILGRRKPWFEDSDLKQLGVDIHQPATKETLAEHQSSDSSLKG